MQLSIAAAQCFSLAGRSRIAALLRADVADVLLRQGNSLAAAALYDRVARLLLRDGWPALAATLLLRLADCQKVPASVLTVGPTSIIVYPHIVRPCGHNDKTILCPH